MGLNIFKLKYQAKRSGRVFPRAFFLAALFASFTPLSALAVIYQPGETLNPACLPTDTNCGVDATSFSSGITIGTTLPASTTNALYQSGSALYWNTSDISTTQTFAAGTSGTDFGIVSSGSAHTFNLPSASGTVRGLLTSVDWTTFNAKQSALGYTPLNPANNLSDIASASTARTNLGLGTLATQSGTFSGTSSGTNTGDQTTISGNAGTATALQTARTINGVSFNGTADITVAAAAGTLTGTTLNSTVVDSSLTSVGTITSGTWTGTTIAMANGGTGTTNGSITGTGALSFTSNTTNALTLDSGTTGAINIGNNANAKTITIGNGMGATSLVLNAGTGNIDVGANAVARTINVGTGAAVVETINIGGTGANVIGIGNTQTGGSVNIGAGMTTGTITIGGTGAQTGTITIDGGTGTQTLNLGTGAGVKTVNVGSTNGASTLTLESGTGALNIGTGAFAKTITIGNATGATRLNLNAGTGGYFLNTNLGTQTNGKRTLCWDTATFQLFKGNSATSCDTSSARYKHDIADIGASLGIDAVMALRPVSYAYNSDNEKGLGFIAEEVALVDDRLVVYNDGVIDGINSDRFAPILTKAIQEQQVLLGDISPKINADGSDNGLSILLATIQSETAHDPVAIIAKKITDGMQFLIDFVAARVTAIRGYFDEVFAKKIHTEQICLKKSDGNELCINGDQLEILLEHSTNAAATPAAPVQSYTAPEQTPTAVTPSESSTATDAPTIAIPTEQPVVAPTDSAAPASEPIATPEPSVPAEAPQ